MSIISLIFIPSLACFAGFTSSTFFMVADFCESVHGAIYENQFPIYGTSLGLLVNCYDDKTRTVLYSQQYMLYTKRKEIKEKMSNMNASSTEYGDLTSLYTEVKRVLDKDIKYFTECRHVYDSVVFAEKSVCKNGLDYLKELIQCICWLCLVVLVASVGITRLKALVDKKSMEFEVRIKNKI